MRALGVRTLHDVGVWSTMVATLSNGRIEPVMPNMDVEHAVREVLMSIPAGRVASYGDIGDRLGVSPRQVGRVMSLMDGAVPWWRVVHADGTPATCHGGQAARLLIAEGTPMLATRVDMSRARHP